MVTGRCWKDHHNTLLPSTGQLIHIVNFNYWNIGHTKVLDWVDDFVSELQERAGRSTKWSRSAKDFMLFALIWYLDFFSRLKYSVVMSICNQAYHGIQIWSKLFWWMAASKLWWVHMIKMLCHPMYIFSCVGVDSSFVTGPNSRGTDISVMNSSVFMNNLEIAISIDSSATSTPSSTPCTTSGSQLVHPVDPKPLFQYKSWGT